MKWPELQARLSVVTEVGAGLLFAAGLITPFAAAGMIGVMVVAIWAVHRFNGFLIIKEGWEYTTRIALVAWAVATVGPGEYSLDHALGIDWTGWTGVADRRAARRRRRGRPARRLLPAARQVTVTPSSNVEAPDDDRGRRRAGRPAAPTSGASRSSPSSSRSPCSGSGRCSSPRRRP